jgi:tetratricopeptide (TPR) repeat protein
MSDERGSDSEGTRQRRDETSELTFSELERFEPPTGEIPMDDLEEVSEPPPVPGLGLPRREKRESAATLKAAVVPPPPGDATPPAVPRPPGRAPTVPPPPSAAATVAVPAPARPPATPAALPSRPPPPRPSPAAPKAPSTPGAVSAPSSSGAVSAPSSPGAVASPSSPGAVASPTLASAPAPRITPEPSKPAPPPPEPAPQPSPRRRGPRTEIAATEPPPPPAPVVADPSPLPEPSPPPERPAADESAAALRRLLERELDQKPEPERAARLRYELGRLFEVELGDVTKAAEQYQLALRQQPDHAAALRGARRTLAALGRHAALPALFDAEVKVTRDPSARARLLYAKARVMEEHLRQAAPALEVYKEALALEPGNLSILKAIERALRRDKAFAPLSAIYAQLANAVQDPALRAAWTALRARLTEVELKDAVQARALYESAFEADPHASTALASLKRLSARQAAWPELVRALRRELALTEDDDARFTLLTGIAALEEQRLGDGEAAVATLEEALALRPGEVALLADVARLHRAAGRPAREAEALGRIADAMEAGEARAALCHRIGRIHEQDLADLERARGYYERALTDDPAHRGAATALAHLHEAREEWDAVVRVWTTRADALQAPRERAELHHRVGVILEHRSSRPERATEAHARALGLDPEHAAAFDALSRLLASAGRWRELAELYQRAIDRASHSALAIAWLFRLGALLEDRLDDPEAAIAVYERILGLEPANLGALHAVARAAERAGRFDRLAAALTAEADRTPDRARAHALRHRAAEILADSLGDAPSGVRLLEGILKEDGKHRASLETLARLYADQGKWEELVGVLRRLVPILPSAAEKARAWTRIGEVQELQIASDRAAVDAYREALRLEPEHAPARDAMVGALTRLGAHAELATALEEQLARAASPEERARLATALGGLYEEKLGKREQALEAYERALAAIPLHRPALDARERLLTEAADWKRLAASLTAEAAATDDRFVSTHAALRAALVLAEQQGAVAPALEAFRPVFDVRPDHVGALLAVEEIYGRTRDDDGLAATYEKMAEVVTDPKAKRAVLEELARARAAAGADTIDVQRRILRLAPDDAGALEAIAAEAERKEDRDTLLAMQARLATTSVDGSLAAHHQTRVGELLLADRDARGALAAFREALRLDPRSIAATRGLTRAARAAGDPEALREAARHEEDVTRDRPVAVDALLHAARLRQESNDLLGAAEDYERALALDPDDAGAAAGLRAVRKGKSEVPRLLDHLGRAALAARDPRRACALHLEVAELQADGRGDLPAAIAAAQRALTAQTDDPGALGKLARYYERNGQWREAAEALETVIARSQDEGVIDAHLRLAAIAEQHLDDVETATRSLRAVLKRQPDRAEAIAPLVRLERARGHDEEALRLARRLVELAADPRARAEALAVGAELQHSRGEHGPAAEAALDAVAVLGPESNAAKLYRRLVKSAPSHASWESYASALDKHLEGLDGGAGASAVYRELARVFAEGLNRPDRALATLREGIEACPADVDLSLALVDSLAALSAHDRALGELRRILGHDVRVPRVWRALAERARALGEIDGAAVALAPLVTLGEASADEQRIVRGRVPRTAEAPAGILGEAGLKQIVDGQALESSAVGLTVALGEVIAKIEGIDYERYGIAKRDRIKSGEGHPLRAVVDRIGSIFGVGEVELFVVKSGLEHAVILPGAPPALLVPAAVEGARDVVRAFELARPLALLGRQLHALDGLAPEVIERILVAAARQVEPEATLGLAASPELEAETRRVAKAIPWLSRGRIQEAAAQLIASPPAELRGWIRSVRRTAARAALLVCDDLVGALDALREPLGPDNTASDLARFWVSDPAMRFRRAVAQQI